MNNICNDRCYLEPSQDNTNQAFRIAATMQHSCSPNDVRRVFASSQTHAQRIKITPRTECSVEMQLNENEALAEANEFAMYQRIVNSRRSSCQGYSRDTMIDYVGERHPERRASECIPKAVWYPPPQQESLVGALCHYSNTSTGGMMYPSSVWGIHQHNQELANDLDEGVFELEM